MTKSDDIRAAALTVLAGIAPEADFDRLDPTAPLQEQLDLDSFDFLQFAEGLSTELDVEISERDYPKIATLDGCTAHVQQMLRHDAASAHQTTRAER